MPRPGRLVGFPAELGHGACPHHLSDLDGVFDPWAGAAGEEKTGDCGKDSGLAGFSRPPRRQGKDSGVTARVAGIDHFVGCGRPVPLAILEIHSVQ